MMVDIPEIGLGPGSPWYLTWMENQMVTVLNVQDPDTSLRQDLCHSDIHYDAWSPYETEFFHLNVCTLQDLLSNPEGGDIVALTYIPGNKLAMNPNDASQVSPHPNNFEAYLSLLAEPKRVTHFYWPCALVCWAAIFRIVRRSSIRELRPQREIRGDLLRGIHMFVKFAVGFIMISLWTQTIKLAVREDRPYWVQPRFLKQYAMTCESGGGFPSGHLTSSSYTVHAILNGMRSITRRTEVMPTDIRLFQSRSRRHWITLGLSIFVGEYLLFLVAISRLTTSSHFPHQTVAGWAMGILGVAVINKIFNYSHFLLLLGGRYSSQPQSDALPVTKKSTFQRSMMRRFRRWNILFGISIGVMILISIMVSYLSVRGLDYTERRAANGCRITKEASSNYLKTTKTGEIMEKIGFLAGGLVFPVYYLSRYSADVQECIVVEVDALDERKNIEARGGRYEEPEQKVKSVSIPEGTSVFHGIRGEPCISALLRVRADILLYLSSDLMTIPLQIAFVLMVLALWIILATLFQSFVKSINYFTDLPVLGSALIGILFSASPMVFVFYLTA